VWYSFFLEGGRCFYVPCVFRKALSITPHFLLFHCLLPSTSMYINCTKEGGRVQVKHHKTCFYFGNEPCFHFYVMGGPPIPNIFWCSVHPMAICEILPLIACPPDGLVLFLLGMGSEGSFVFSPLLPNLFPPSSQMLPKMFLITPRFYPLCFARRWTPFNISYNPRLHVYFYFAIGAAKRCFLFLGAPCSQIKC